MTGREASCVVADCTYTATAGSSYCTLHVVKWGREADPLPESPPARKTT